ncbi:MAG TPA: META domain-containing protein [Saprospiraceae bacterium]|nr:META domain-containing protein [Saprospiraceae bacterium]HQW57243.1 META domain-containing protein [Saprospiraceae bacterium]
MKYIVIITILAATIFVACHKKIVPADQIHFNREWMIKSMADIPQDKLIKNRANINLSDPNAYSAYAGCNNFNFKFKQKGDQKVEFTDILNTLMACDDMSVEDALGKVLKEAAIMEINGHQMTLKDANGVILLTAVAADWD